MYVIADIEWIQNILNIYSPTQLSAIRVDDEWEIIDEFFSYIKPTDTSTHDWNHMAYTGGKPEDFLRAKSCHDVFQEFNTWIGEDTVCWWSKPSADIYTFINEIVLKNQKTNPAIILSKFVHGFLNEQGNTTRSAYKLARERGIEVPELEHDARNDVAAVANLLKGVAFKQETLFASPIKPEIKFDYNNHTLVYLYDVTNELLHKRGCPLVPKGVDAIGYSNLSAALRKGYKPCSCVREELRLAAREKITEEISRSLYTFIYAENGSVFHRYDCGLMHNAHHFHGAIKYNTVIKKGLRPCKVCNPTPEDKYRPGVIQKKTPKLINRSLTRSEMTAMARLRQSQKERYSGVLDTDLTEQEKNDLYTLTQPGLAFFAAVGYQNFHTRNCSRLVGKSNIRGFDTYFHARKAGYTPCKYCKPSEKNDIAVSIPIDNKIRTDETVEDLSALCNQYGYEHSYQNGRFELTTPAGKWRIHTDSRPITVDHINTAKYPNCKDYHKQPRIFLSMLDALSYIYKHDAKLLRECKSGETV